MSGEEHVLRGQGDEGIWMSDDTIHAELWYPRVEGNRKRVTVGMTDVRAADDLTIEYDFDRDGWSITREVTSFNDEASLVERSGQFVEVAFIAAYTEREETR